MLFKNQLRQHVRALDVMSVTLLAVWFALFSLFTFTTMTTEAIAPSWSEDIAASTTNL